MWLSRRAIQGALGQRLVHLPANDAHEPGVDFPTAIHLERTILGGDMVEQEDEVQDHGGCEFEDRQHPDDQREEHTTQDHGPLVVVLG